MDSSHSLPGATWPGARAEACHSFPPWRLTYRTGVATSEEDTDFAEAAGLRIEQKTFRQQTPPPHRTS
jgi:hypothetical protein